MCDPELLVSRMHEPPLPKAMLPSNSAPVLFSSRMNPLPSEWLLEMSTFSNDTLPRTMLSWKVPPAVNS